MEEVNMTIHYINVQNCPTIEIKTKKDRKREKITEKCI